MSPRILALRRVSFVLLLLWVVLLVGTFLRGRLRQKPPIEQAEVERTPQEGREQPIRVHKGFVYSDTLGIEPNFRISAPEAVEFASGWYEFRDVQVSLYHKGEVAYGLVADKLRFDPAKHEALTLGRATVSLKGGVTMQAGSFTLGGPDRKLQSTGVVTFAGPGWAGLAGSARSSLQDDSIELSDRVSVTWRQAARDPDPPLSLLAPDLIYDRRRAVIRFPKGVTLLRGGLQVKAPSADMQLSGVEGELRSLALDGPVLIEGVLEDGGRVRVAAGRSVLQAVEAGRYSLVAEPQASTGWVEASWADGRAGWRQFAAWRLVGEGTRAAWEWLEGQGQACAWESQGEGEPRRMSASRIRLVFDGGRAREVQASEAVRIETGDQWAEGENLEASLVSGTFTLRPAPGKRVILGAPDTTTWCDMLQGTEGGTFSAQGEVMGAVEQSGANAQGRQPLRFAAASATASQGGTRVSLEGDARLWQGQRLARADRLDYDKDQDVVTAEGGVLTTAKVVSGDGPGGEAQVRSRKLRYEREAGVATYEGDVVLEDPKAEAACQRLRATMDDRGNLALADLDGGVTVRDRATARVITGQKARLRVEAGVFDVWGNPVLVNDPGGNQVKAEHLRWDRGTNTIVVLGAEDNPSETIYHPASPTPTRTPEGRKP